MQAIKRNKKVLIILALIIFSLSIICFFALLNSQKGETNASVEVSKVPAVKVKKPSNITTNKEINLYADEKSWLQLSSQDSKAAKQLPRFINLKKGRLYFNPKLKNTGSYTFQVISKDKATKYTYNFKVKVKLPRVNFKHLKNKVETILGNEVDNYAVHLYDLKREKGFGINHKEVFYPGSISKILYAIIALRDVDAGKLNFYSVSPTIVKMINYSRNDAMMELDELLGGNIYFNERVKNELEVENFFRMPHTCTAFDIAKIFKGLYRQKYLSKEMNDYMLGLLKNNRSYNNRLLRGLPYDIEVAHKTGWIGTDYGEAYNDAALVYGEVTDFVLVVLNKDTYRTWVMPKMKAIAEVVYEELE